MTLGVLTAGDRLVLLGDVFVLAGLLLTYVFYVGELAESERREIESDLALLTATRTGIRQVGDIYFKDGYGEDRANKRAQEEFNLVMSGSHGQVFVVPPEPLTALIARSGEGWLIDTGTLDAANIALWRLGTFNQLVGQQTLFNALHAPEFYDENLPRDRREVLARSAQVMSRMLHLSGIGDAGWYHNLIGELDRNIERLSNLQRSLPTRTIFRPRRRP